MTLLKKIGGFFVEMPEKKPPPKPVEEVPEVYIPYTKPIEGEFSDHFKKIMKDENDRNFPGNDFYEFLVMKNGMIAIPSEQQRYQIAFSGLSAAGMTKDKLLSTAQRYSDVVDKEIEEFTTSYDANYLESVTKIEEEIARKTKEMNDLAATINKLNSEITEMKGRSLKNQLDLSGKKESFMAAGKQQKKEIGDEITKINQYIQ